MTRINGPDTVIRLVRRALGLGHFSRTNSEPLKSWAILVHIVRNVTPDGIECCPLFIRY